MTEERLRQGRYRSVPARRAGMEARPRKQLENIPCFANGEKAARAFANTHAPTRRVRWEHAFSDSESPPRTRRSASLFPRRATGVVAVSGTSRVRAHTHARTRERRIRAFAFPSRLSASTSARVFPCRVERALTRPRAPRRRRRRPRKDGVSPISPGGCSSRLDARRRRAARPRGRARGRSRETRSRETDRRDDARPRLRGGPRASCEGAQETPRGGGRGARLGRGGDGGTQRRSRRAAHRARRAR